MSCPMAGARIIAKRTRRLVFFNIQAGLAIRSFILRDGYAKESIGYGYRFRAVRRAAGKIESALGPIVIYFCDFHLPFFSCPDADLVVVDKVHDLVIAEFYLLSYVKVPPVIREADRYFITGADDPARCFG